MLYDRAVDDEARRHPFYDVIPTAPDFVSASGALWKSTRASAARGRSAWDETANLRAAIADELPPAVEAAARAGFAEGVPIAEATPRSRAT